jgi:hypothetical protein
VKPIAERHPKRGDQLKNNHQPHAKMKVYKIPRANRRRQGRRMTKKMLHSLNPQKRKELKMMDQVQVQGHHIQRLMTACQEALI